jgi:hypothetical protein
MTAVCVHRGRPRRPFTFDVRDWISGGESSIMEGEGGRGSPKLQRGETPLPAR